MRYATLAASLVLVLGCGDKKSLSGNEAHNAVLEDLGVGTSIGPRKTPAGKEVAADYNPTRRPLTALHKRSELFFAGTRGQGASTNLTPNPTQHAALDWPDGATDFVREGMQGDDSWLQLPKAMAAGDVDGDGIDEVVVAYLKPSTKVGSDKDLAVRVLERSSGTYVVLFERVIASYTDSAITEYPGEDLWTMNFGVTCGDVDRNGQAETMVTFNGSVFLLGDRSKDLGVLKTITYTKSADTRWKLLRCAAGDLNDDGADEFVVVESSLKSDSGYGSARYHMYSGVALDEIAGSVLSVTEGATTVTLRSASVAVGDLDGDGLNEVLFAGLPEASGRVYMFVLDSTWNTDTARFEYAFLPDYESFDGRGGYIYTPNALIADFDGDGKKEMLALRYIYENLGETGGVFTRKSMDVYDAVNAEPLGAAYDVLTVAGDLDGDMRDEVVFVSDGWWEIYVLGFNDSGQWTRKQHVDIWDSGVYFPYVAVGDFDGDSTVVKFVNSEILFTDPHPIVVLASNPFWDGVSMDGETSFGTTVGNEVETERSIGFSVGFSVGYESEGPFSLWKASFKVSFESAFDWTATQSVAIEESYTYSTSNEDKVIFTTVPYDVYYYEVVVAPKADMVGKTITVNLPRKPVTLAVERGYYNEKNGSAPDIDGTILTHKVGRPLSYPKKDQASVLNASGGGEGIKSSQMLTVGQGTGSTAIEMSVTNANGSGTAFDFSVSIEAEVGAGGVTAGVSAGFHYGESYTVTTSNGTVYGGSVGNIPTSSWSLDKSFSWGLFSYRAAVGSQKFVVVQYYTEAI